MAVDCRFSQALKADGIAILIWLEAFLRQKYSCPHSSHVKCMRDDGLHAMLLSLASIG